VKASIGTAFKAPTLDNLYNPNWGRDDLKAQNSTSWEIGLVETFIPDKLSVFLTYFDNKFDNLIRYDNATFYNTDLAKTNGIEAGLLFLFGMFEANLSYTHAKSEEEKNGVVSSSLRRPEDRGKASVSVKPLDGFIASLEAIYFAERYDDAYDPSNWESSRVTLDAYTLVNLFLSYEAFDGLTLYANAKNLFDTEYVNAYSYQTKGLDIGGGFAYTW
jgi:vitamin B12 transporter